MTTTLEWMKPVAPTETMVEAGRVFVIRCIPDVFTGEMFNVGVCAIEAATGRRMVKAITDPGRFACFYGESASNVVFLAQAGAQAAMDGAESPSEQIIFDKPTPYYNSTLERLVSETFDMQVTAAIPQRPKANDVQQITDDMAREQSINAIKKARAMDTGFISSTPFVLLNTDHGPRPVYAPFQTAKAVGTIRSANYGAESLKMHLLESVIDLEAAQRWRNKPHAGLFILRPASKDKKHSTQIDNVIDHIAWRCNKSLRIEVEPTPDSLAYRICEWADANA